MAVVDLVLVAGLVVVGAVADLVSVAGLALAVALVAADLVGEFGLPSSLWPHSSEDG